MEGLRKNLVQSVLQKFVESHDGIKVSGTGSVSLANIRLKNSKLSYFQLVHGYLRSVVLQLSLRFYHVNVEEVYLVLSLQDDVVNPPESSTTQSPGSSYKPASIRNSLKERLSEGLWGYILHRTVLNIRKLHLRLEHNDFAYGITFQDLTFRNGQATIEYFSFYCDCLDPTKPSTTQLPFSVVNSMLSQSLPTSQTLPHHQYFIRPIPSMTLQLELSLSLPATVVMSLRLTDVALRVLDVQCIGLVTLLDHIQHLKTLKAYKYRTRPQTPMEWWWYSFRAIRYLVRQGYGKRQWRSRYMALYEKQLLQPEELAPDERLVMVALEEGRLGDLDPTDIGLYQLLLLSRHKIPLLQSSSWLSTQDQNSYNDLLAEFPVSTVQYKHSQVVVSLQLNVTKGQMILQSPLPFTLDEPLYRRIQQDFLEFDFADFDVTADLMGDLETLHVQTGLNSVEASEIRLDKSRHMVLRCVKQDTSTPFLRLNFIKKPPIDPLYDIGVDGHISQAEVFLCPENDWIYRIKPLVQPLPSYQKISKYWKAMSLASINSWASRKLGLLAKVERIKDRKRLNLDLELRCPCLKVQTTAIELAVDLGILKIRTVKLAGTTDRALFRDKLESALLMKRTPPTNAGGMSVNHSLTGSAGPELLLAGGSVGVGSMDDLFATKESMLEDVFGGMGAEEIFYDMFSFKLVFGGIFLRERTLDSHDIPMISPCEISVQISKSTIPADHTLCRYKISCHVGDFILGTSSTLFEYLQSLTFELNRFLNSDKWYFPQTPHFQEKRTFYREDSVFDFSSFNIAEDEFADENFLDAMETASFDPENGQVLETLEDDWASESGSIFDTQSRISQSRRNRRSRQLSISDASTISEGSLTKKTKRVTFDNGYLSAENLAKLDEGIDEEDQERNGSFEEASFASMLSPSRVDGLIRDLEERIDRTVSDYADAISSAQCLEKSDVMFKKLQLRIKRRRTEIMTLRGYLADLRGADGEMFRQDIAMTARKALASLEEEERLRSSATSSSFHDMTRDLGGELFQIAVEVSCILLEHRPETDHPALLIRLRILESFALLKKSLSKIKTVLRVNHVSVDVFEGARRTALCFCGFSPDENDSEIPISSRFPEHLSTASSEDPFLRTVSELREPTSVLDHSKRKVAFRCMVGDIDIQPSSWALLHVRKSFDALPVSRSMKKAENGNSKEKSSTIFYLDLTLRMSNIRVLVHSSRVLVMAVGDLAFHCLGCLSPETDGRTRVQMGTRWASLRILDIYGENFGECDEIVSMRGVFDPFFRARCRFHLLSGEEDDDWVIGWGSKKDNFSPSPTPPLSIAYNFHAGVRVDGVSFLVSPRSIDSLIAARTQILGYLASSKLKRVSNVKEGGGKPFLLRWRVHTDTRNVRLCIRPQANFDQSIESTLNASIKTEPSHLDCHSIFVAADLHEIRIWDLVLEKEVLAVSESTFDAYYQRTAFGSEKSFGLLPFNRDYHWNTSQISRSSTEVFGKASETSVICSVNSVTVSVGTDLLGSVLTFSNDLKRSIAKHKTTTMDEETNSNMHRHLVGGSFSLGVRKLTGELQLLRGKGSKKVVERSLMMEMRKLNIGLLRGPDLQMSGSVGDLRVFCEIRNHRAEILRCMLPGSGDSEDFLTVTCSLDTSLGVIGKFGDVKFLLFPQGVQTVLMVGSELKRFLRDLPERKNHNRSTDGLGIIPRHPTQVHVICTGFSLCIPSEDIYRASTTEGTCSVVVFRCQIDSRIEVSFDSEERLRVLLSEYPLHPSTPIPLVHGGESCTQIYMLCRSLETQILRTNIQLTGPDSLSIVPPRFGDQRITNPFDISLTYYATVDTPEQLERDNPLSGVAHSVSIESSPIDIISYISQSSGGMRDAIRVSLRPILESLKSQENIGSQRKNRSSSRGLRDVLCASPGIFSIHADSIRVTCVPGGATRTTESPILNFSVSKIELSGAISAVPADKRGFAPMQAPVGDSSENISGVTEYHTLVTTNLEAEISASCHNRRLVLWEPVLEPFDCSVVVGMNLVQLGKTQPIVLGVTETTTIGLANAMKRTPTGKTGKDRLRTITRLLGSPLSPFRGGNQKSDGPRAHDNAISRKIDLCFVILRSTLTTKREKNSHLVGSELYLPGTNSVKWIQSLGYPNEEAFDSLHSGLHIYLTGRSKLNVNLSGNVIEVFANVVGSGTSSNGSANTVPHTIQNRCGMVIRFKECLEHDRIVRGERASKISLENGKDAPLALKRTLSQACDPHAAYMNLELCVPDRGSRYFPQTNGVREFDYFVPNRVPVDHVGVYKYFVLAKEENKNRLNWDQSGIELIVRVNCINDIKSVSVESPLGVGNVSNSDLVLQIVESNTGGVLWRKTLPGIDSNERSMTSVFEALPSHLVEGIDSARYKLIARCEEDSPSSDGIDSDGMHLMIPSRFSKASIDIGVVTESHVSCRIPGLGFRHFHVCGLRVGSPNYSQGRTDSSAPEQRMILIRSALSIHNHLPFQIEISYRYQLDKKNTRHSVWKSLGALGHGGSMHWTEWPGYYRVEMRMRILDEEYSHAFPHWSSTFLLPLDLSTKSKKEVSHSGFKVVDSWGQPLEFSTSIEAGSSIVTAEENRNSLGEWVSSLSNAGQRLNIFTRAFVVDSTGLHLLYRSRHRLAGQPDEMSSWNPSEHQEVVGSGGLRGIFETPLISTPGTNPKTILMMGRESSNHIWVRCASIRGENSGSAVWSEPLSINRNDNSTFDIQVFPSSEEKEGELVPYSVRSRLLRAPTNFGGNLGTKILHLDCRFYIANELGRAIELRSSQGYSYISHPNGKPRPLHLNFNESIRFRPLEYGWSWSGRFHIIENRKEFITQLRHSMKEEVLMASVDVISQRNGGSCTVILKEIVHPPYRIDNHTMTTLKYRQLQTFFESAFKEGKNDMMVMPFHGSEFAWDEPDYGPRSIVVEAANLDGSGEMAGDRTENVLGRFDLDKIAPGTCFRLTREVNGVIETDGPTRVLKFWDTNSGSQTRSEDQGTVTLSRRLGISLSLGVSVIDWSPKELLYLDLSNIQLNHSLSSKSDDISLSIGGVTVNNQLWITPYPVAVRIGAGAREGTVRRKPALSLSLKRSTLSRWERQNLDLIEKVDVNVEPIRINLDGELVAQGLEMSRKLACILHERGILRKDEKLMAGGVLLDIVESGGSEDQRCSRFNEDMHTAFESSATVGIASKLRSYFRPLKKPTEIQGGVLRPLGEDKMVNSLERKKYYVERLRTSALRVEINWTGTIPMASDWVRPSLTFEGLPLFLGSLNVSHIYGHMDEQIATIKSQFVTFPRVVGFVAGLLRPTFLFRAWFFTSAEMVAAIFRRAAVLSDEAESRIQRLIAYNASSTSSTSTTLSSVLQPSVDSVLSFGLLLLKRLKALNTVLANSFRYDPRSSRSLFLRSRNPRLFSKVNDQDVLVEYVEGESAGRAILSRVRMGAYIGEGYALHLDAVDPENDHGGCDLILMLSLETLLLLKGELSPSFCEIVFEVSLKSIVQIEINDLPETLRMVRVVIHFLQDHPKRESSSASFDDPSSRRLPGVAGLTQLESKVVHIQRSTLESFEQTMASLS